MNSKHDASEVQRVLYEKYAAIVHRRCRRFFRDEQEAEDATSEVFMKLLEHWGSVVDKENASHWIHRTTTNHCISIWRRKKFDAPEEAEGIEENPLHADDSMERMIMLRDIVRKILFPWNQSVREILVYTYWDGYNQDEIASLTGIAPSTIRKHLTNFKRKTEQWMLEKLEVGHEF